MQRIVLVIFVCLLMFGCNGIKSIKNAITKTPPYHQYIKSLEKANLAQSPMAKAWVEAGQTVFNDSIIVDLPFSESGYFQASEPGARSYRFDVKEGQVLTVKGAVKAKAGARLFLDLFVWKDSKWDQIAYADSTLLLSEEFSRDYSCLLRIQPELLTNAYYSVSIALTPVLINPVSGASNKSIKSFYGADRDGGRRRHEGVDIFAPKGTPVVAPTDGFVSRLGNTGIGGKVVWIQDRKRGHSYYFAHLDKQLVEVGTRVKQGDTLGLVGNTGNARTTPPHLHFGIYQRGSKDPIHYIHTFQEGMKSLIDTSFQIQAFKVVAKTTNLRSGPGAKHLTIGQAGKDTYVEIIGQSQDWYRIALPNKKQAYVFKKLVSPVEEGSSLLLHNATELLSEAEMNAVPVAYLNDSSTVKVLAQFENYRYVKTRQGQFGWVLM